jgi:hypothetical protein
MGKSDFMIDSIADIVSSSHDDCYDVIFNFDNLFALAPPTSSSATNDELDNTVIESLLKTEQDGNVKSNKDVVTRKSIRKRTPVTFFDILRKDRKKKGLSLAKFNEIKDGMTVTANKGVVRITVPPKKRKGV